MTQEKIIHPLPGHTEVYYCEYDPFLIAQTSEVTVKKIQGGGNEYTISLSNTRAITKFEDPWLAGLRAGINPSKSYVEQQLHDLSQAQTDTEIQIAKDSAPLRWAGGGGMVILTDSEGKSVVPLIVRARTRHSFHEGCLEAMGGLSGSIVDLFNPQALALRETLEELLMWTKTTHLHPQLPPDTDPYVLFEELSHRQRMIVESSISRAGYFDSRQANMRVATNRLNSDHQDVFTIKSRDGMSQTNGLGIVDATTASIEFRQIYEITLPCKIEEITILDGETAFDHPYQSRDREVLVFALEDLTDAYRTQNARLAPLWSYKKGTKHLANHLVLNWQIYNHPKETGITPALNRMLAAIA